MVSSSVGWRNSKPASRRRRGTQRRLVRASVGSVLMTSAPRWTSGFGVGGDQGRATPAICGGPSATGLPSSCIRRTVCCPTPRPERRRAGPVGAGAAGLAAAGAAAAVPVAGPGRRGPSPHARRLPVAGCTRLSPERYGPSWGCTRCSRAGRFSVWEKIESALLAAADARDEVSCWLRRLLSQALGPCRARASAGNVTVADQTRRGDAPGGVVAFAEDGKQNRDGPHRCRDGRASTCCRRGWLGGHGGTTPGGRGRRLLGRRTELRR